MIRIGAKADWLPYWMYYVLNENLPTKTHNYDFTCYAQSMDLRNPWIVLC